MHTKCKSVRGGSMMKLFETQQKATVIAACWHSNGGSLPIVRRWSSASSDRNLKQPYQAHRFQLQREEIPPLLFAPFSSSRFSIPDVFLFANANSTPLVSYFLMIYCIFKCARCVYWEIGQSLSISTVLNWHVIKETYMEEREWVGETEKEQERGNKGRYCIAVAVAATYIHCGPGSPLPKLCVCWACV